jgi:indolepyruvate ferredoxin oxidoreductase alpha subunit
MERIAKELLAKKQGFLFGNEAVVRGALEAGVAFVSSYPGTPASEIGDTFRKISRETRLYFEYSTNEKVALEAAAGAAFSGVKAMVSMKHYGLNVALDSLLPLVYLECPLVIVVSDDPGCWSSVQTEEDTRWISHLGNIPTFEPSNPKEAKEMTKMAFDLARQYKIPILIHLTTRVCYWRDLVLYEPLPQKIKFTGKFPKDPQGFKVGSARTIELHQKLLAKIKKIKKETSEKSLFNKIFAGKGEVGIISSGISFFYVKEAIKDLKINPPLLKIGESYPFPENKVKKFLVNLKKVLIVEEEDPILEGEVKKIVGGLKIKIYGKEMFSEAGEYKPEDVLIALAKIFKKSLPINLKENIKNFSSAKIDKRIPSFCPGCPHQPVFYAVREVLGKDKIYGGDIGCYLLGAMPPFYGEDFIVAMGAGIGISHGISQTNKKKPVAFIGDSTFFHAGIPALINLIFNQADILVIILNNHFTSMTGQQPHPETGENARGITKKIAIEDVIKSIQVDWVKTVSAYNLNELKKALKEGYEKKGVCVLITEGPCRLGKRLKGGTLKSPVVER